MNTSKIMAQHPVGANNGADRTSVSSAELRDACSDFESIFISMIMRQMLDSIPKSGPKVAGSDLMQTLSDQAVASHIAKSGGFGLAKVMYEQLAASLCFDTEKV